MVSHKQDDRVVQLTAMVGVLEESRHRLVDIEASLDIVMSRFNQPDEAEQCKISKRFQDKFNFPHCVFVIDGALFPLAKKPKLEDAADYNGRKLGYTINAIFLCDNEHWI